MPDKKFTRAFNVAVEESVCPDCQNPSLARGGLALSCRSCGWQSSIEDTAEMIGWPL